MPVSSSVPRGRESGGPALSRSAGLLVLGWAAALTAWGFVARDRLPIPPRHPWPVELERRAPPYARYDSGWYLGIVERGYGPARAPGQPSEHAFFPLYPALVRLVARATRLDPFRAGILVSTACAIAAAWLFWREGLRRLPIRQAWHALLFFLLFPTSFFLLAMYSESLFLLLALLAFAALARERRGLAALFGFLAGLTRAPAVALCAPLLLAAWPRGEAATPARRALAIAVAATPAVGVVSWIWAAGWISGVPDVYLRAQQAWHRGVSPLSGAVAWGQSLAERLSRRGLRQNPAFLLDYAYVLLFALLAIFQARRRRWADAAFTAGALLLPIATGIPASIPRYVLVVYPAFFALAELFHARPVLRRLWWFASTLLLLAGAAAFVHWRWVA